MMRHKHWRCLEDRAQPTNDRILKQHFQPLASYFNRGEGIGEPQQPSLFTKLRFGEKVIRNETAISFSGHKHSPSGTALGGSGKIALGSHSALLVTRSQSGAAPVEPWF
jgi:hypothetical protein